MKIQQSNRTKEQKSAFNKALTQVRKTYAKCLRGDALARYKLGQMVSEVKQDETKYSKGSVDQITEELGIVGRVLYHTAAVAERWSQLEFENLLKRADSRGKPLSWTHFVELAKVNKGPLREEFINQALAEDLGVGDLRELIQKPKHQDNTTDAPSRMAKRYRTASCRLLDRASNASESYLSVLSAEDAMREDVVAELQAAKESEEKIRDLCVDNLGKIDRIVSSLLDATVPVLGTVAARGHGFIEITRSRSNVQLVTVTRENRDELPALLAKQLRAFCQSRTR